GRNEDIDADLETWRRMHDLVAALFAQPLLDRLDVECVRDLEHRAARALAGRVAHTPRLSLQRSPGGRSDRSTPRSARSHAKTSSAIRGGPEMRSCQAATLCQSFGSCRSGSSASAPTVDSNTNTTSDGVRKTRCRVRSSVSGSNGGPSARSARTASVASSRSGTMKAMRLGALN